METIYIVLCIVGVVLLGLIVWRVFFPAINDDTSTTPATDISKVLQKTSDELTKIISEK